MMSLPPGWRKVAPLASPGEVRAELERGVHGPALVTAGAARLRRVTVRRQAMVIARQPPLPDAGSNR
jgi:hypothetical protein